MVDILGRVRHCELSLTLSRTRIILVAHTYQPTVTRYRFGLVTTVLALRSVRRMAINETQTVLLRPAQQNLQSTGTWTTVLLLIIIIFFRITQRLMLDQGNSETLSFSVRIPDISERSNSCTCLFSQANKRSKSVSHHTHTMWLHMHSTETTANRALD